MKELDNDEFEVTAGEMIEVVTTSNKRPLLVGFQTPPAGATWQSISTDPTRDKRNFTAPTRTGSVVSFDVEYEEAIGDGDPDPVARYKTTFRSLSDPVAPTSTKKIAVPKDAGPVPRFFKFTVK